MHTSSFLPPPRVPLSAGRLPDPQLLDGLVPGAGDPIRVAQGIVGEANDALRELEAGRPGGLTWAESMAADADALTTNGSLPKVTRTEALAKGDLHRWTVASAMARSLLRRVAVAVQPALDDGALLVAAGSHLAEVQESLEQESAVAYSLARKDSAWRGDAWKAFNLARALSEEATVLRGLTAWLDGRDGAYDPRGWGAGWSPEVAGYMLGAADILEGTKRLTIPQGVRWPEGHPLAAVMVSPGASTSLLGGGPHSVPGSDE